MPLLTSAFRFLFILCASLTLSACVTSAVTKPVSELLNPVPKTKGTFKVGSPYKIDGKMYYPKESYDLVETGIASWYGPQFHGRKTANGETFDMNELTAAHRTLQMPSLVRVTNLENGRSLVVRVNDRGPYKRGRIIDLSKKAAELLGYKEKGTAKVRLEVLREESVKVAEIAKSGRATTGYEIAANNRQPITTASSASAPAPVTKEILPGHARNGQFYPDPVITEMPVVPSNIYVQAGAFSVYDNAVNLRNSLAQFAPANLYPAQVNGQQFYRVRLGPVESVEQADEILARLVSGGHNEALIIIE